MKQIEFSDVKEFVLCVTDKLNIAKLLLIFSKQNEN